MRTEEMQSMTELVNEWHKERLDFIHELACKYPLKDYEICRLCAYLEVQRWELNRNELEKSNVH